MGPKLTSEQSHFQTFIEFRRDTYSYSVMRNHFYILLYILFDTIIL